MAKAPLLTPRKASKAVLSIGQPSIMLPSGTLLEAGMVVTIAGEPEGSKFRFKYARNGEVTVWGGLPKRESWRTFVPAKVLTAAANVRVEAVLAAVPAADVAAMTPGQKAAHTKRLKAAAASMAVAA